MKSLWGPNEFQGSNSDSLAALIGTPWKVRDCRVERWKFVLSQFGKIEVDKKGPSMDISYYILGKYKLTRKGSSIIISYYILILDLG